MADSKISALSAITTLDGTEEFVVADSGATKKITAANVLSAGEFAYVEFTSNVTVSGTVETAPTTIVSAGAVVFDGSTRVCIEFYASAVQIGSGTGSSVQVHLWDGSTDLGRFATYYASGAVQTMGPCRIARYITPTAASHTYLVRAWRSIADGTVEAGSGGTSNQRLPGFIRVVRA